MHQQTVVTHIIYVTGFPEIFRSNIHGSLARKIYLLFNNLEAGQSPTDFEAENKRKYFGKNNLK